MTAPRRPRPISARPAHDAAVATETAAAVTVDDVGAGPGAGAAERTEVAAAKTVGAVSAAEDTAHTTVVHQTAADVLAAQNRLRIFVIVAAVVVLLLNLAVLLWFVNYRVDSAKADVKQSVAADLKERDDRNAVLAAAVDALRADAIAKGQQPVAPPAAALVTGVQTDQTAATGPGATDEQVRSAVALYFLANPPQPGRPATDAENDRAVAFYCAANNCRGQPGETVVGRDGRDGTPGPGPTDQQVADSVTVFCAANNNCAGPKGDKGDKGDPGPECPFGYTPTDQPAPLPSVDTWRVCVKNP